MLKIIEKYQDIIDDLKIIKYIQEGSLYSFRATIIFKNKSKLVIKEYLFENSQRKYAYHWMTKDNELIVRWDNVPHWKKISTFPHHKHLKTTQNVHSSVEINLDKVLGYIQRNINKPNNND